MREIKFRAWHKKMRSMDEVMTFNDKSREIGIYNLGDFHLDEVEVMQNTGIKDKNGVEVYEGDIVKFGERSSYYYPLDVANVHKVIFYKGSFVFDPIVGSIKKSMMHNIDFEVIGNIYENKEMLK